MATKKKAAKKTVDPLKSSRAHIVDLCGQIVSMVTIDKLDSARNRLNMLVKEFDALETHTRGKIKRKSSSRTVAGDMASQSDGEFFTFEKGVGMRKQSTAEDSRT